MNIPDCRSPRGKDAHDGGRVTAGENEVYLTEHMSRMQRRLSVSN